MPDVDAIFGGFPILKTERLILRQVRPSDVQTIYDLYRNPEVTRYYGMEPYTQRSQADELIKRWQQRFADKRLIRWVITRENADWVIGTCGFNEWKRHFYCAGIGYDLAPPYWKKGFMTEALTAVISFGFNQMHLNRIEAFVMTKNEPSAALLRKLGFKKEGLLREYGYWRQAHHDLNLFALLKREYKPDKPG